MFTYDPNDYTGFIDCARQFDIQVELMKNNKPVDLRVVYYLPLRDSHWASAMGARFFADPTKDRENSQGPLIRYDIALRKLRAYAKAQDPDRWRRGQKRMTKEFPE